VSQRRERIIARLSSHLEANTTSKLLQESPRDFKAPRISVRQQPNAQKKATIVMQCYKTVNATYDRSSPCFGWSADDVAARVENNFRERPKPKRA
jgi:hypothetical protein